uniref:putative serine protease K12H4.7 n=1 Tax=Ciona intestinalis TaxID=7719 RepID=UPI000180D33E|nr:putative serine protease K12H4.7 [Ciona intestinalis]|eukprot:XP_018667737.1 putative serine protease K12H4.7 [Ciona intestinalis]
MGYFSLFILTVALTHCVYGFNFYQNLKFAHKFESSKQDSANDRWIEQRLNNFDSANVHTWKQRYFANNQFSTPNGPVFLSIGGEGPAGSIWMTKGHWVTMAKQTGAMLFMIEHRFYGKSHPTPDASLESLSVLSSEQALADIANFITNITAEYKLAGRKWIVFGGSYSGSLAIWARYKYPHLISGAVSASAPLHPIVNFDGYQEVVQRSLQTLGSPKCVQNLANATTEITSLMKTTAGRKILTSEFNLCHALSDDVLDNQYFQESVAGSIQDVVQYNRDNMHFEGHGPAFNISYICHILDDVNLGSPLKRYAEINRLTLKESNVSCLDSSYQKFVSDTKATSWDKATGMRQWLYQTCTEFGWFQSSDSTHQPFKGFPLKFSIQQCQDIFGIPSEIIYKGVQRSTENYGGLSVAGLVTNVTLYNGLIDPWSDVSYMAGNLNLNPENTLLRPKRNVLSMSKSRTDVGIVSLIVPNTAHCAIMYPASDKDSIYLKKARLDVENAVKEWLGM